MGVLVVWSSVVGMLNIVVRSGVILVHVPLSVVVSWVDSVVRELVGVRVV